MPPPRSRGSCSGVWGDSLLIYLNGIIVYSPDFGSHLAFLEEVFQTLHDHGVRTVEELQITLDKLRTLADGLESMHKGTTIGSLTGGVIGAAGGITSIVGLILAPFTLGASLIVTGVGIGVAVAGGATAGVSNITNMVNQSTDRRAIKNIIKEFQEKMNSVVTSLQDIAEGLETLRASSSFNIGNYNFNADAGVNAGARFGRGLGCIPELFRFLRVATIGNVVQFLRVATIGNFQYSSCGLGGDRNIFRYFCIC
ncbi:uncharacterized protein LOC115133842 [Oncorhynchus nerka]|uniref:uncharacterized protein LOC115133842 n=1 Tax=Oncorhynchus nerka TaxID=8023 RepID=UPI0031B800E0